MKKNILIDSKISNKNFNEDECRKDKIMILYDHIRLGEEILSIASHELKNPLTTLCVQIGLLGRSLSKLFDEEPNKLGFQEKKFSPSVEKLIKSLESCELQSQRLVKLVDQLTDIVYFEDGKLHLHKEPVELSWFISDFVERQNETAPSNPAIHFHASDTLIIGRWDIVRLEQILGNLISNALKYGKGKPIEICANCDISRSIASFSVRDFGVGIPLESQEKVFHKFGRGSGGQGVTGLGLGLFIVKKIVEAHGGEVFLQSTVGEGSTFTVELPLEVQDFETYYLSNFTI